MAATLAATFTLTSCVQGSLCIIIKVSGILFGQLSVKSWTGNIKLKILNIFTWSVYENMALQLAMYYMSSHASACYFLILRHGGVFEPTLTTHWHDRNDSHNLPQGGLGLPQLWYTIWQQILSISIKIVVKILNT